MPRLALLVHFDMKMRSRKVSSNDSHANGLAMRRSVLGEAHVTRATRSATDFDRDFQDFITRYAWGEIWTRPGLPKKTRSLLTIAILAALGREEELKLHVRATRNTGASANEVKEVLMQVAVYAGVPAANAAFRAAKAALEQMAEERRR
jgi:4-carboxymuconolactone decarboxylase